MASSSSSYSPPFGTYPTWSRTIIGPLTTTWTPPAQCTTGILQCADCATLSMGRECISSDGANTAVPVTTCWPAASSPAPTPYDTTWFAGWGFHSPGLVCPHGYQSACTATAFGESQWAVQFSLTKGETAVGCCPTGLQCAGPLQACTGIVTSGQQYALSECFGPREGFDDATVPLDFMPSNPPSGSVSSTVTVSSLSINAPMIQIVWRPQDLTKYHSASPASVSTQPPFTSTPTSTSRVPSSGVSNSDHNERHSSSLSLGAEVGIGVGVGGAALIVLIALILFIRARRKSRAQATDSREPYRTIDTNIHVREWQPYHAANDTFTARHEVEGTSPDWRGYK